MFAYDAMTGASRRASVRRDEGISLTVSPVTGTGIGHRNRSPRRDGRRLHYDRLPLLTRWVRWRAEADHRAFSGITAVSCRFARVNT